MTSIGFLIISNLMIGVSFLIVPLAAWWLYYHRHKDWPKAWVLMMVGVSIGACGFSRLIHAATYYYWPHIDSAVMALTDSLSAVTAVVSACFIPWASYSIRRLPTPAEIRDNALQAGRSLEIAAHASRMAQEKELAQKSEQETQDRIIQLKSLLDHANLDPSLRERILYLVERKGG